MLDQNLLFSFGASEGIPGATARAAMKKAVERFKAPARVGRHCEINPRARRFELGLPRFLTDFDKQPREENICALTETWGKLLPELQVKTIRCRFSSDARLPWPDKPDGYETIYREGIFRLQSELSACCQLTCKPEYKTVTLSMDVGNDFAYDEYRQIFLRAMHQIASVLKVTYATRSAMMAARKKPRDDGYIKRAFGELFREIGAILPISAEE